MITRLSLFLAIISLSGCSNKKIELDKLELRDNFYYSPNASSKFSGTGFTKLSNGKISNEIKFEEGVPKGRWFAYGYDHEVVQEGLYRPIEFAGNGGILTDQVVRFNVVTLFEGREKFVDLVVVVKKPNIINNDAIKKDVLSYLKGHNEVLNGDTLNSIQILAGEME